MKKKQTLTKLDPNKKVIIFSLENTTKKPIDATILNPSKVLSYKFPKGIKFEYLNNHLDYKAVLLKFLSKKALITKITYQIKTGSTILNNDQFKNIIIFGHTDDFGSGEYHCVDPIQHALPEQKTIKGRLKKKEFKITIDGLKYELNCDSYIRTLIDPGQRINLRVAFEFIK